MHGRKTRYHDERGRTAYVMSWRGGNLWSLSVRGTDGHRNEVGRYRTREAAYAALRASGDWEDLPDGC